MSSASRTSQDGAFTELMRTAKGKAVRADFRLLETDERAHALTWEQQLEGTPFARVLREARTRVSLEPADGGTRVTIELEQKLTGFFPRFGGFMVRRAAAGDARGGARRPGADRWLSAAPRMRWWGWGDPEHPPGLPAHALGFLAETVGAPRARARRSRSRTCGSSPRRFRRATLAAMRAIVGAEHVRDDHAERVLHAAGKGYPDLVRLRAGEPEGAPDAVVLPGDQRSSRSCSRCARANRSRSSRSAAARASSVASRRCAARMPP